MITLLGIARFTRHRTEPEIAWDQRGIDYQRPLIDLTVEHIAVQPSPQRTTIQP
jgi:hypothetical protein